MASVHMNYSFPVQNVQRKKKYKCMTPNLAGSMKEGTLVVHDSLICAL